MALWLTNKDHLLLGIKDRIWVVFDKKGLHGRNGLHDQRQILVGPA